MSGHMSQIYAIVIKDFHVFFLGRGILEIEQDKVFVDRLPD